MLDNSKYSDIDNINYKIKKYIHKLKYANNDKKIKYYMLKLREYRYLNKLKI